MTYQFLEVLESTNVLVVEEDLRYSSATSSLLHFIAPLRIVVEVHFNMWDLRKNGRMEGMERK